MGRRLIDEQRMARPLGKIRAGYFDTSGSKGRPARSETWIVTSTDKNLIEAVAEQYGRPVERYIPQGVGLPGWKVDTGLSQLEAILPKGDPLSVSYEIWSKGGVQRRCDGGFEDKSGQPCLCKAQYGPKFYETAPVDARGQRPVCKRYTRIGVILPDAPDVGEFLVESKGFYASEYIRHDVDFIKEHVGPDVLVPIYVVIEPVEKMKDGKKKNYIVVHLKQRNISTGQFLAAAGARHRALMSTRQVAALEAAPAAAPGYLDRVAAAASREEILAIRKEVAADPSPGITAAEFDSAAKARLEHQRQAAEILGEIHTRWTGTEADLHVSFAEFVSGVASLETATLDQLGLFRDTLPDVAEAELVDEPADAGGDGGGQLSREAQRALFASFGDLGITDRDDRLRDCSTILGRTVTTSNALNASDASTILDVLKEADGDVSKYERLLADIAQAHQAN
ncbi:recombination directionality factor [Nonomuraea sp. LPB2021202275-12-8]|uniref:recombination directionality factor n=1 Tax=Nonomuraea sp. LPB2021202275-12-8 TaxID=3120159 RepID=UPI00300C1EEE